MWGGASYEFDETTGILILNGGNLTNSVEVPFDNNQVTQIIFKQKVYASGSLNS